MTRMIEREINAPLTSSLGRLFDAAAAVILNRRKVDYDAQAAIELEGIAVNESDELRRIEYLPELIAAPTGSNREFSLKIGAPLACISGGSPARCSSRAHCSGISLPASQRDLSWPPQKLA